MPYLSTNIFPNLQTKSQLNGPMIERVKFHLFRYVDKILWDLYTRKNSMKFKSPISFSSPAELLELYETYYWYDNRFFSLFFRRFLARRGNFKVIYSDNGKIFNKAKRKMEKFYDVISDNLFLKFLAKERIVWKHMIERDA